jgi:hypothetical protein
MARNLINEHEQRVADEHQQVRSERPSDESVPPSHRPSADGNPGRTPATPGSGGRPRWGTNR